MLGIGDGVVKPDIYFLYLGDKVLCTSYQHIKTKQTMIGVENFEESLKTNSELPTLELSSRGHFWEPSGLPTSGLPTS